MSQEMDGRRLMMEIEIKFGKGRSDRVQVHYGDDPAKLASDFVVRHKLKETSTPVITKYITTTMENFLSQPRLSKRPKENTETPATDTFAAPAAERAEEPAPATPPPPPPLPPSPMASSRLRESAKDSPSSSQRALGTDVGANLDEADLLSHITRSLSLSVDHKHFHESATDRKMTMRTFSLKDIASELANASAAIEPENRPSLDSDSSTIAMTQPSSKVAFDAPALAPVADRPWDRESSRRSPVPGIGYPSTKSHRANSPAPGQSETLEQQLHMTADCEEYNLGYRADDLSPSKSNRAYDMREEDMYRGYGRESEEYTPSESGEDSVAEAEVSAEELYNRLRSSAGQGHATTLQSSSHYYGSEYGAASARVLKPSSTTMQLSLRKSTQSNPTAKNDKTLVGKSTCERLHNAAQLDRNKRERRAKHAADSEMKAIEDGRFKLNANSKKIVSNLRPKAYQQLHIGERLYEEGVVEKQLKYKRADELKDKLTPEEWSCARCGTFQKVYNTAVVIQPLHQMQNKAKILNNTGESEEKSSAKTLVCKECGWNQSQVPTHKPVNIALSLSDEPEDLLKSRWQGNEPSAEGGGIHQYLYENARTRENIQQLNRVLWNEAHSGLTFAPVIPESSVEILGKYKHGKDDRTPTSAGDGSMNAFSNDLLPPPPPSGLSRDKNIIAGPAIGEYFSKSATDRLSTTQTRPVLSNALQAHRAHVAETESRVSTMDPASQEQFVNRLVYEYKEKRERRQKRTEYATNHDLNTGEQYFKPQVGPDPSEALGLGSMSGRSGSNKPRTNVFENILEKDRILKLRKKEAEERAADAIMRDLNANQVKALDTSHQILKQSTESNIEELFQVLLEAQDEVIQDGNAPALQAEVAAGSPGALPEWRTSLLLDLDQINPDMLIPEVGVLLNEIRAHKLQLAHSKTATATKNKKSTAPALSAEDEPAPEVPNMLVSYTSFRKLILQCMKKRDGTGKSYVYVPKKKPDVTLQMIQEQLKEETFRPTIDRNSANLCLKRHKELSDYPIEDLLQVEGERIRSKWESARQERILQASRELTFKPKLYKPPSYVKPKYWGMEERLEDSDGEAGLEGKDIEEHGQEEDPSVVSSDEEPQVVQMPALQARGAPASAARAPPPLPGSAVERPHASPPQHRAGQEIENTPLPLPERNQPAVGLTVSPLSKASDEHSVITMSTQFTVEETPVSRNPPHTGGRSVNSAAPLVTRRNPSSIRKSGAFTPTATGRASLSSSNARKVMQSGNKPKAAAPPPLPIDIQSLR